MYTQCTGTISRHTETGAIAEVGLKIQIQVHLKHRILSSVLFQLNPKCRILCFSCTFQAFQRLKLVKIIKQGDNWKAALSIIIIGAMPINYYCSRVELTPTVFTNERSLQLGAAVHKGRELIYMCHPPRRLNNLLTQLKGLWSSCKVTSRIGRPTIDLGTEAFQD